MLVAHVTSLSEVPPVGQRGLAEPGSIPVDFVEVGEPRTHKLDNATSFDTPRSGTPTAVAVANDGARALLCAHVGMPELSGGIARKYPTSGAPNPFALAAVQSDQVRFDARLVRGELGGELDWALAHFASTKPVNTNPSHTAAFARTPVPRRKRVLKEDDLVHHFSPARGRLIDGDVVEFAAAPLKLRHGKETIEYLGVVVVKSPPDEPFSEPGDSGSLVVDDSHFAWGVIIGASTDGRRAYVLTLPPLINSLGTESERFFLP